jgi:DNA-binding HxlR family transcriptional regulator
VKPVKRSDKKSNCAINYSLESVGDLWSLLIVRDIVFFGKRTFGEFLSSEERIGTTTLSRRLKELEKKKILRKTTDEQDKRVEEYDLTEKGLDLIPILLDMTSWGAKHDSKTGANQAWARIIQKHRATVIERIQTVVKKRKSVVEEYDAIVAGLTK